MVVVSTNQQLVQATWSTVSVISIVDIAAACRAVQVAITSWNRFGWNLTDNNNSAVDF